MPCNTFVWIASPCPKPLLPKLTPYFWPDQPWLKEAMIINTPVLTKEVPTEISIPSQPVKLIAQEHFCPYILEMEKRQRLRKTQHVLYFRKQALRTYQIWFWEGVLQQSHKHQRISRILKSVYFFVVEKKQQIFEYLSTVLNCLLISAKSVIAATSSNQRLFVVIVHLHCSGIKDFY